MLKVFISAPSLKAFNLPLDYGAGPEPNLNLPFIVDSSRGLHPHPIIVEKAARSGCGLVATGQCIDALPVFKGPIGPD